MSPPFVAFPLPFLSPRLQSSSLSPSGLARGQGWSMGTSISPQLTSCHCIASRLILPNVIASHRIVSHHVLPYCLASHRISSHRIPSHKVLIDSSSCSTSLIFVPPHWRKRSLKGVLAEPYLSNHVVICLSLQAVQNSSVKHVTCPKKMT